VNRLSYLGDRNRATARFKVTRRRAACTLGVEGGADMAPKRAPTRPKEQAMKSLLDPSFKYVPSVSTDLRRTFARVRKQQAQQRVTVVPLPKRSIKETAPELVRRCIDEPASFRRHERRKG
jgi:hypothetical protein